MIIERHKINNAKHDVYSYLKNLNDWVVRVWVHKNREGIVDVIDIDDVLLGGGFTFCPLV